MNGGSRERRRMRGSGEIGSRDSSQGPTLAAEFEDTPDGAVLIGIFGKGAVLALSAPKVPGPRHRRGRASDLAAAQLQAPRSRHASG
jgi:hypothetical protein